jgi:hypothetical protein
MAVCLHDLARLAGGELRLAAMPPRDGELKLVRRIVFGFEELRGDDLYWCFDRSAGELELAFLRGAAGVVAGGAAIEPWPGRFALHVDDPVAALKRLVDSLLLESPAADMRPADILPSTEESFRQVPELKVLQLCAARGVDIYPLTCGRTAKNQTNRRCRRQAA